MMLFPTERRAISRRENGTELVRATVAWSRADVPLLHELIGRAERWVDEVLVPRARQAYLEDPDPSKRFVFRRFEYDLTLALTPSDDDTAELWIEATLARRRGETLAHEQSLHYLRLSDGAILPPSAVEKLKKAPQRGAK